MVHKCRKFEHPQYFLWKKGTAFSRKPVQPNIEIIINKNNKSKLGNMESLNLWNFANLKPRSFEPKKPKTNKPNIKKPRNQDTLLFSSKGILSTPSTYRLPPLHPTFLRDASDLSWENYKTLIMNGFWTWRTWPWDPQPMILNFGYTRQMTPINSRTIQNVFYNYYCRDSLIPETIFGIRRGPNNPEYLFNKILKISDMGKYSSQKHETHFCESWEIWNFEI